jgi:hypothetical protein
VTGFPLETSGLTIGELVVRQLDHAAASGLVESRNAAYAMNPMQAADAIQWLTGSGESLEGSESPRWTRGTLLAELATAGARMSRAALADEPDLISQSALPPALGRWAEMARQETLKAMADLLLNKVDSAIQAAFKGKLTSCPEAVRWLETAQRLSTIFEGPLEMAIAAGQRQLELFHRESRDEKHLENYYPRKERPRPEDALERLLNGADDLWALHYLGVGGVGKTMLLRYIQVRLARKLSIVTARVDFDSLNPDFPVRAPGLLLIALARELALRTDLEISSRLGQFQQEMESIHRTLEGALAEGLDVNFGLNAQGFEKALDAFSQALDALPVGIRPLLILDTCEELARLRPDGTLPKNVEATFDILKQLHDDKFPRLRVVFSGRRPLAHVAAGWTGEDSRLPDRPYLSVYLIQAFDEQDARGFLAQYQRDGSPVPPRFRDIILGLKGVRMEDEASVGEKVHRYNPYDLNVYAAWTATDESLTEEMLRTSSIHLYVKERIIGRIRGTVLEPWMPHLTALGRFDVRLLQEVTGMDEGEVATLWEETRGREWTEVDRQAISSMEVLVIDPNLLRRLQRYYAEEQQAPWTIARQAALRVLTEATLNRSFRELTPSYFGAALGLQKPVSAADWVAEVERRISARNQWSWLSPLADELESEIERGQKSTPSDHWDHLRAGVLAISAAAKLRERPDELRVTWQQVFETCVDYPGARQAEILKYRAASGRIAHYRWSPEAPKEQDAEMLERLLSAVPVVQVVGGDPELLATEMALVENCVESLERIEWRERPPSKRPLGEAVWRRCRALVQHLSLQNHPPLWMHFARVLWARAISLCGEVPSLEGYRLFETASLPADSHAEYLDWRTPASLHTRIQLEWLRIFRWRPDLRPSLSPAERSPETLDGDRLHSLVLQIEMDSRPIHLPQQHLTEALATERSRSPVCQAHRAVAPSFTVTLEEQAFSGDVAGAVTDLNQIIGDSTLQEHIIRGAERTLWRVIQRMRLLDVIPEPQTLLEKSPTGADRALIAGATAFSRERGVSDYAGRWQGIADPLPFERCQAMIDELGEEPNGRSLKAVRSEIEEWSRENPLNAEGQSMLRNRIAAMEVDPAWDDSLRSSSQRRMAEILLEEGSLAALRNKAAARRLLERALAQFQDVDSLCGELIAELNLACLDWRNPARLARVLETYVRFRKLRPELDLPDWNSVPLRQKWTLLQQAPTMWRPWLIRLAAVEMWQSSPDKPSTAAEELVETLKTFYRNTTFPPDFPTPEWLERRLSRHVRETQNGQSSNWLPALGGFAVLAGLFLGFRWLLRKADPNATWAASIIGFIILLVTLGLIPVAFRRARLALLWVRDAYVIAIAGLFGVRLRIMRGFGAEPDPLRPWRSNWDIRIEYTLLRRFHVKLGTVLHFEGLENADYRSQAIQFGGRFRRSPSSRAQTPLSESWPLELPKSIRWLYRATPMRIDLEVPRECAALPWEAVFGQVGGAFERLSESGMMFRRVLPEGVEHHPPTGVEDQVGVCYFGWRLNPWTGLLPDRFIGSRLDSMDEPNPGCVILHLRGDIVESGSVLYFVEWSGFEGIQSTPHVKVESIPRNFHSLELAVLQAPPLVEKLRLEKDRERAVLFRTAADYLFKNRVPAVVVLPPLTDSMSESAVAELARAIISEHPSEALRKAVRSIQLAIDGHTGINRDTARELAYDACYYSVIQLRLP